jgi:hypothetical protein
MKGRNGRFTTQTGLKPSEEAELVAQVISAITGARFEVVTPPPGFPFPTQNLSWFLRCRSRADIEKIPYLNTVWRETRGPMWLESLALGDTVDWIGLAYGPEMADESLNINYSRSGETEFKAELGRRFPLVLERLDEYTKVADRVSEKTKVPLEIRRSGSGGMMVFTLAARITPERPSRMSLEAGAKAAIEALKEAYSEILRI